MDFLLEALTNWLKEMLVGGIMSNLSGMFDSVNQQVADISVQVGQTPQGWNGSIFSMIENLSNSIMVPIAGVILAIVMTVDLIQMIADKNNLHDVDTWMIFKWVFKSAAAILIVTNTWNRNKNEFILFINNLNSQSTSPILISDITVNNSDIIEVNAEEVEDLDIFDIRENFDSKCREFNELMNNLSIQQNEFNDRMPKHVEQLNAVGATKNMKKIRIAIMAVANDMDDIATLYDESAPKIITIFGEIIDWGVKLQQYDLGDNNEQIKAENREALHSLVIAVLTGKNALINGRNELTKIIGIEKHQKRAQRRLTESYTKIIEAFEKCTIKANDMANA